MACIIELEEYPVVGNRDLILGRVLALYIDLDIRRIIRNARNRTSYWLGPSTQTRGIKDIQVYAMSLLEACLSASGNIEAKYNSGSSDPGVCLFLIKFHCCGAVIIAEGTGSEVNPRVDRPLALVVLALPRVCLLPSSFKTDRNIKIICIIFSILYQKL